MAIKNDIKEPDIEIKIKGRGLDIFYFIFSLCLMFGAIFIKDQTYKSILIIGLEIIIIYLITTNIDRKNRSDKDDTMDTNTNNTRSNNRSNMDRNRT